MNSLLITFYGDDFTGSTDALEALSLGGVPAALFISPPAPATLAREFPWVRAIGVAGASRAMTPAQMRETLPPIFQALRELGAPICHYKVCSTFDSSPAVGSIGCALEIGARIFASEFVPIVVGTPSIRRYVAFGNLFATVDLAGDATATFRIDRHPTMAHHPITPMTESDLRRHLAQQTDWPIGLVDLVDLAQPPQNVEAILAARLQSGNRAILFDTVDSSDVLTIGRLILRKAASSPLFVIGSSGVESALTAAWQINGAVQTSQSFSPPAPVNQIVVMAGSASPATAEQIDWAEQNGFTTIALDANWLVDPTASAAAQAHYCREALRQLATGASVVLYSARGRLSRRKGDPDSANGETLGQAQGKLLRMLLEDTRIQRVCVAGGDTAGRVVQQLSITALTIAARLAPGAPLCHVHAPGQDTDGLELALKGGQVGGADYFGRVRGW